MQAVRRGKHKRDGSPGTWRRARNVRRTKLRSAYGEDGEGRGKRATSPLSQCAHRDTSPYTGEVNRIPQSVASREIGN